MKRTVTRVLVASGIVVAPIALWFVSGVHSTNQSQQKVDATSLVQDYSITSHDLKADIRESLANKTERATAQLIGAIDTEEDPEQFAEDLVAYVQSLPESSLKATLDVLTGHASPGANSLREMIVRRWAESSPRSAAEWVSQLPDGVEYRNSVGQVAIAWAGIDPQAAWGWVASLPDSPVKSEALLGIGYDVAVSQPAVAVGIASTLPYGSDRDNLIVHVVRQWAASEPDPATTWVQAVSDVALRQRLLVAVAESLADRDPVTAASWAASNISAGPELDRSLIEIVQRWAENSPNGAAAWIAAFPDTPLRPIAMQNLLMVWGTQDHGSAARWVLGLPPGSLRDTGFIALADSASGGPR